jgi:putative redox protein
MLASRQRCVRGGFEAMLANAKVVSRLSRGDAMTTRLVRPSSPDVDPPDRPPHAIVVSPGLGNTAYSAIVRGHRMLFDQPSYEGGEDRGPSPVEVFVAALLACVAQCAGRFLLRHCLDRDGLRVTGEYTMADDQPPRVRAVAVRIVTPYTMPANQRKALLAVASDCTINHTLEHLPAIEIELADDEQVTVRAAVFDDSPGRRLY